MSINEELTESGLAPTLLAMMPCPLKVPVEEDFTRRVETGEWSEFDLDRIVFKGNANQTAFYERIREYEEVEQLPDLIVSPGISSFFDLEFRRRFVDKGVFADVTEGREGERFEGLELADPKGRYTVLCINPLVMVVDHTRIGALPVPRSWADLLKPEYRRQVTMRGQNHDNFCETTLLTLRHVYGLEAIDVFGEAVNEGLHPAQMVKSAGTGSPDASPILIMPYFYAKSALKRGKNVSVVWPEEGAIASPVFLLAKASERERVKPLTDYLTGEHVSNLYENASFPALNPNTASQLPEEAKLLWMGWDLVWNGDIQQVKEETHSRFLTGYRKGRDL